MFGKSRLKQAVATLCHVTEENGNLQYFMPLVVSAGVGRCIEPNGQLDNVRVRSVNQFTFFSPPSFG